MRGTLYFLALSALIATSYSAPVDVKDQLNKKVIFTDGKKGAEDTLMARISALSDPNTTGNQETSWRPAKVKAHIAYVTISEVGPSTNATVSITSGGVGSDHLTFKAVPYNREGYHFEVEIWGTIIE